MRIFAWNEEKNRWLFTYRSISFDDVVNAITGKGLLDITPNPNMKRYPHQYVFFIQHKKYVYMVPFVQKSVRYFLKTIIPTRKYLKQYKHVMNKEDHEK